MSLHIGVFGDSYADRTIAPVLGKFRLDESWMQYIASLGHRVSSYGITGSASYHAFTCFLDHHEQFDHIVFCWSYVNRIQTMPFKYAQSSSVKDVEQFYSSSNFMRYNKEEQADIVQILLGYQHLCDINFNNWVQQKMFDDVNEICYKKNIKLVNLLPFIVKLNHDISFSKKQGDCLYRLIEVSKKEMEMSIHGDVRSTHLSKENNQVLGDIILQRFFDDKNIIMDLYKEGKFFYNPEIEMRYNKIADDWARELGLLK